MRQTSLLAAGCAVIAGVTAWAVVALGPGAAAATFVRDLAHPWRAQFYTDLELHLLLFAAWVVWRERSLAVSVPAALATLLLGALFTFPYLILAALRAGGDTRKLLLGARTA